MKIAYVTDTYFPRVNGVSTSTRTFASELTRLGHDVQIFAPRYPNESEEVLSVHRFPSTYLFFDPEDRLARPNRDKDLVSHFIEQRFDVVHTQTPFSLGVTAVAWARQSGARLVHTYHTLFTAYVEHYLPWFPKALATRFASSYSKGYCDRCDLIIAPSAAMKARLSDYGVTKPIDIIPTGTDLARFDCPDGPRFRRALGIRDDEKLLLFMGRVAREKNIEFLIRIISRATQLVPKIRFIIAGEGAAKPSLKRQADRLGLSTVVIFLGYLNKEDLRDCYAAADLFIFSSLTETQGLVVTEAMAVGTPVVAIGEMGICDVMASGRGGIMTRQDEGEFLHAVVKMLTDSPLYQLKKSETRSEAERWSSAVMAQKMHEAYHRLCDSPRCRAISGI